MPSLSPCTVAATCFRGCSNSCNSFYPSVPPGLDVRDIKPIFTLDSSGTPWSPLGPGLADLDVPTDPKIPLRCELLRNARSCSWMPIRCSGTQQKETTAWRLNLWLYCRWLLFWYVVLNLTSQMIGRSVQLLKCYWDAAECYITEH